MCGTGCQPASLALRAAMLGPRRVDSLGRRFINSVVHIGRERARDYPRARISVLLDFARPGLPLFPKGKEPRRRS